MGKKTVDILAPANKSDNDVLKIIKSNSRWIFRNQLHFDEKQRNRLTYEDGSKLLYLGREYTLHLNSNKNTSNRKIGLTFQRGKFIANITNEDHTSVRIMYEEWLKKQAAKVLNRTVVKYSKVLGLDYKILKIKVKSQKKRAGSLGRNLTVNFNKNLLRLPLRMIEYVVAHELCHVRVPNHSKKYWQLVSKIMVDYKQRKDWLEKNCDIIIS